VHREDHVGELRNRTIDSFLDALSSANPTPGGGSVAALSAAIAASLGAMVGALATKKSDDPKLHVLGASFAELRERFTALASEDERAFEAVMAAYRIPRDDRSRGTAIQAALRGAADVPLKTARDGVRLLSELLTLAPLGTKQSTSDAGVAALLARAAVEAAALNVRVNLAYLEDDSANAPLRKETEALEREAGSVAQRILAEVDRRLAT
jgi:formiminotetrahydrofolate cyclodeaminase